VSCDKCTHSPRRIGTPGDQSDHTGKPTRQRRLARCCGFPTARPLLRHPTNPPRRA
jgi:hypothetical protein